MTLNSIVRHAEVRKVYRASDAQIPRHIQEKTIPGIRNFTTENPNERQLFWEKRLYKNLHFDAIGLFLSMEGVPISWSRAPFKSHRCNTLRPMASLSENDDVLIDLKKKL